jgi:ankyrin repeat protein
MAEASRRPQLDTLMEIEVDASGVGWLKHKVSKPFGRLRMTALAEACSRGRDDQVAWHLSHISEDALAEELRAVDDWAGSSPLHWASFAVTGTECVRLLIKAGAPVALANARDGSAAIHLAARYGRGEAVRVLVAEGGCNVDTENLVGNTALHECSFQGFPDVAETLCDLQADMESSNRQGLTPLLAAAQAGHLEVVKILLGHGARTDVHPPRQMKVGQGRRMSITDERTVTLSSAVR